jgi:hypothetical protein
MRQELSLSFKATGYNYDFFNAPLTRKLNSMKNCMKPLLLAALFACSLHAFASEEAPSFEGPNFSGVYACKGSNNKVGEYEVFATLKLNRANSHGNFGVYDFTTETENEVVYKGQAIANGYKMALTFNLTNRRSAEFSTGIADVAPISSKRWAYTNHYYEPDETGGDYGREYCQMQKQVTAAKKVKKKTMRNAGLVDISNLS